MKIFDLFFPFQEWAVLYYRWSFQKQRTCDLWGCCTVVRCRFRSPRLCWLKKTRGLIHLMNWSRWPWGWEVFPMKLAQQSVSPRHFVLHQMLIVDTLLLNRFWLLCHEKPRMGLMNLVIGIEFWKENMRDHISVHLPEKTSTLRDVFHK